MPENATYSNLLRSPKAGTLRALTWTKEARFQGWRCSECAWDFSPSGQPTGNTLNDMKENYMRLRDKEFATHVCAQHPRPKARRG
jgi:hypothetical protein